MPDPVRVAYVVSKYPAVSHTFIQREIDAVRQAGGEVVPISVRATPASDVLSEVDRSAAAETVVVLPLSSDDVRRSVLGPLLRHPSAVLGMVRVSLDAAAPGLRGKVWALFYVVEALVVWQRCADRRIRHLHAHFANVAANLAMLASWFGNRVDGGGWSWSFTMHGPTEFADVTGFALASKVRSADAVACISDYCRSQLMTLVSEEHWSKLHIVHCGVDPDRFARVHPEVDGTPPATGRGLRVLCVGRLVAEKGQSVLVDAVHRLSRRGVSVDVTFVGDGPNRRALEREIARRGLGSRIHLAGAVGQDHILEHYVAADVFCLPSFAEGVPVVLMEAMACGLPVVTTRIAGIPELVRDGVSGDVLPPGRADLLADALARLADDPALRRRYGEAGRAAVLAGYVAADAGPALVELFTRAAR